MPPNDFPEQLDELLTYLKGSDIEPHLLGSSQDSSIWAAERGLPYVFADFIYPAGEPFAAYYRENCERPYVSICVWAICAATDEEALRLSYSARMLLLCLYRGRFIPVPPVKAAEEFLKHEGLPPEELPGGRRLITGSPEKVRREIEAVATDYGADEIFVVNVMHDHQARMESYRLLAGAFL